MRTNKAEPTTVRFTILGKRLLAQLVEKHGVSQSDVIEMAIREKAEREIRSKEDGTQDQRRVPVTAHID